MNLLKHLFFYNWKYSLICLLLFVIFWNSYSLITTVNHTRQVTKNAVNLTAGKINDAFSSGNVLQIQKILWELKIDAIKHMTLQTNSDHPSLSTISVGSMESLPNATMLNYSFPIIYNGFTIGHIH